MWYRMLTKFHSAGNVFAMNIPEVPAVFFLITLLLLHKARCVKWNKKKSWVDLLIAVLNRQKSFLRIVLNLLSWLWRKLICFLFLLVRFKVVGVSLLNDIKRHFWTSITVCWNLIWLSNEFPSSQCKSVMCQSCNSGEKEVCIFSRASKLFQK